MIELRWDGKYDASGKRVAPLCVALPFETIETVNEGAADRNRMCKEPGLQKTVTPTYDAPGVYRVMMKVLDILGNDTTKILEVGVRFTSIFPKLNLA